MSETPQSCQLGQRFIYALVFASQLHQHQQRKGSEIPYVSHLMSVSALVLEDGGDEDEAIAGLLHDAVEDQGGKPTLEIIRSCFGDRVAHIVEACSDADTFPKPPWRWRKEQYIEHLQHADRSVLRVALADKLHNARAIVRDYRSLGEALWDRFNAGRDDELWYYRSILKVCRRRIASPLLDDLDRTVSELEDLIDADTGSRSAATTEP
jgi:(p)ppGpp synthase/HD superfamily hydrolase